MNQQVKRKISPKKALYLFSVLFMLALIIVMTFGMWVFDPTHMDWKHWSANTLILVGIQIPSIVIGELMSKDRAESDPSGKYQASLRRFKDTEEGVIRDSESGSTRRIKGMKDIKQYFSQFFYQYKRSENFKKKVDFLESKEIPCEIAERIVRYYKPSDVDSMTKGLSVKTDKEGKEIPESQIDQIPEGQIEYVRQVLEGRLDIQESSAAYYYSADSSKGSNLSILEKGPAIAKERERFVNRSRLMKIGSQVFFSAVFAALVIDAVADPDNLSTWVNLISRLSAMVGGLVSGWMTSVTSVKMEASEVDAKCDVRETYLLSYASGDFKPKSLDEELDEKRKAEEEKRKAAVEAVVVPEPSRTKLLEAKQ